MKTVSFSLPDDTVRRLDQAAEEHLRSRSNMVAMILQSWLSNPRTAELAQATLGAAAQYFKPGTSPETGDG